jgi:hypothetical protein
MLEHPRPARLVCKHPQCVNPNRQADGVLDGRTQAGGRRQGDEEAVKAGVTPINYRPLEAVTTCRWLLEVMRRSQRLATS